jgi:hypothetical protein
MSHQNKVARRNAVKRRAGQIRNTQGKREGAQKMADNIQQAKNNKSAAAAAALALNATTQVTQVTQVTKTVQS